MPWEGLLAERDGVSLTPFYLDEYDVPYGYTPTMLARPETLEDDAADLAAFLEATARGYEDAAADPEAAAAALQESAEGPNLDDREFLEESARRLADTFLTDDGRWGVMEHERWAAFVDWLAGEEILTSLEGDHIPAAELDVGALYTNDPLTAD